MVPNVKMDRAGGTPFPNTFIWFERTQKYSGLTQTMKVVNIT